MTTIEATGLTRRHGDRTTVDGVSFTLRPGTVTGFVGVNGAGKSTTLRMVLGLTKPSAGRASFDGRRYDELPNPTRTVGAFLDPGVFHPRRRARDALRIAGMYSGVPPARVDEVLALVGLEDDASRPVGTYSTGMRQRLGLGLALLGDPPAVILDEPANGLDPLAIAWLRGFLRDLGAAGRTVLVASHQLAELEMAIDHVLVLHRGRLLADGPTREVVASTGARTLEAAFVGLVGGRAADAVGQEAQPCAR